MNNIKSFIGAVICGAGVALGAAIVKSGIESARNPYKKAERKRRFEKIKNSIKRK